MYNKHVQIARNIMQNIQNGNKTFNEQEDMRWPEAISSYLKHSSRVNLVTPKESTLNIDPVSQLPRSLNRDPI